jgi:hypothetical protein
MSALRGSILEQSAYWNGSTSHIHLHVPLRLLEDPKDRTQRSHHPCSPPFYVCVLLPCRQAIDLKPLGVGQTFQRMLGYVHKDRALPHFRNVGFGVTESEIEAGIEEHASIKLNPLDDKIMLNKTNLFLRAYAWMHGNPGHEEESFATVISTMLSPHDGKPTKYAVSPSLFMNHSGQMREEAAETYFKTLADNNMKVTPEMVCDMLYSPNFNKNKTIHDAANRVAPVHGPTIVPGRVSPMPSEASYVSLRSLPQAPATAPRAGPSGVRRQAVPDDSDSDDSLDKYAITTPYERIKRLCVDRRDDMERARARRRVISPLISEDEDEEEEPPVDEPTAADEEFLDDRDEDDLSSVSWSHA